MTTNDLIEKYGIGHNCLSDAYALGMMHGLDVLENTVELAEEKAYKQGRADKYQEITSGYMLLTEKQVDEIRADAIDECIEILKDTSRRNCSHLLDEIVYMAVEQMENLKEQKNNGR